LARRERPGIGQESVLVWRGLFWAIVEGYNMDQERAGVLAPVGKGIILVRIGLVWASRGLL